MEIVWNYGAVAQLHQGRRVWNWSAPVPAAAPAELTFVVPALDYALVVPALARTFVVPDPE